MLMYASVYGILTGFRKFLFLGLLGNCFTRNEILYYKKTVKT